MFVYHIDIEFCILADKRYDRQTFDRIRVADHVSAHLIVNIQMSKFKVLDNYKVKIKIRWRNLSI